MDGENPDVPEPPNDITSPDDLDAWREANYVDRGAAEVETPLKGRAVTVVASSGSLGTAWRLEEVQCSREDAGLQLWAVLQSLDGAGRTRFVAIRSLEDLQPAD